MDGYGVYQALNLRPDKSFYSAIMNAGVCGSQMSKGLKISGKIWITVWAVAALATMVGGITPAESWRFNIQLPGVMVALLLLSVTGPFALLFGASGGVFVALVTILTNGLIYAALISLVLVVVKASKRES
jgi:hypothetical protein